MRFVKIISEAKIKKITVPKTKRELLHDGTTRFEDKYCIWYLNKNSDLHRIDGPAQISKVTGREDWYLNGEHHRIDGPAIIDPRHNLEAYYVNGNQLSKEEFDKHFGISEAWSPYPVKHNKRYYEDALYIEYSDEGGYLHRKDGPAWISKVTGREEWFIHGNRHRTDGPAIIDPRHNLESYWVHGKEFSKEEFEKHFGGEE